MLFFLQKIATMSWSWSRPSCNHASFIALRKAAAGKFLGSGLPLKSRKALSCYRPAISATALLRISWFLPLPPGENATPFPKPLLNWKAPSTPPLSSGSTEARLYNYRMCSGWNLLAKTGWRCTCRAGTGPWCPAPAAPPNCGNGWRGDKKHPDCPPILFTLSY